MGLYPIDCPVCKKAHMWFSGNIGETRCSDCQKNSTVKEKKMTKKDLEAKIIALEARLAALEAKPICIGHYCCGCTHNTPVNPPYNPTWPGYPYGPIWMSTTGSGFPPGSTIS